MRAARLVQVLRDSFLTIILTVIAALLVTYYVHPIRRRSRTAGAGDTLKSARLALMAVLQTRRICRPTSPASLTFHLDRDYDHPRLSD